MNTWEKLIAWLREPVTIYYPVWRSKHSPARRRRK